MPVYTYRREDGTTFEIQQKFLDDPLEACPTTGQKVVRVIQMPGIIFKGSGFYVNDSKSSKQNLSSTNGNHKGENAEKPEKTEKAETSSPPAEAKTDSGDTKAEKKAS